MLMHKQIKTILTGELQTDDFTSKFSSLQVTFTIVPGAKAAICLWSAVFKVWTMCCCCYYIGLYLRKALI